ncbi:MAG: cofactor-independent phosphoglycerate mutase [Capsulimonadaceae bacterium]|nr:cofactor-independent phosphoglycerate mutase [Capsulimonadaceae bacterium]
MKYILLVPDGMADLPLGELDGQTPWQAAKTPNFDRLAKDSLVGTVLTVPSGMYPGSDACNMTLMGYDPKRYYTGRGPIEAAAMDVPLEAHDAAYRCSLVTCDGTTMIDYSSEHISTEESRVLIELVDKKLGNSRVKFYPGVSYRHIMAWRDGVVDVKTTPPHDITAQPIAGYLPQGDQDDYLRQLMFDSLELLSDHPINQRRIDQGKRPGNMIWLWGQGYAPNLPSFFRTFGKRGAVITAVDLLRGLGKSVGLQVINVPGATGYIDTNYAAKAAYAVEALRSGLDFVFVHIEAPDEAGHEGNIDHKIGAIQDIDRQVVGPVVEAMRKVDDLRLVIVPDHATPISLKTHKEGPVPFLLYDSTSAHRGAAVPFDERAMGEAKTQIEDGTELIRHLFAK